MESREPRSRSLAPKEHGAYGQLGIPLLTALSMGSPTPVAGLLLAASVAAFLLHEPVLVLLGRRGGRAAREHGPRARRWLVVSALVSALCASAALGLASTETRVAVLCSVFLAVVSAVVVWRDVERTLAGELIAGATLSSTGLAVATGSHVPLADALAAWAVFAFGLSVATLGVRAVVAHAKTGARLLARGWPMLVPSGLAGMVLVARVGPAWARLAAGPLFLVAWALILAPPKAKALPRLGWALVAATVVTMGIVVVGFRLTASIP